MNQQFVRNSPALLLKQTDRTFQIDCVPEDDCGHYQVQSAGAIPLILEGPVSHLAEAVKEHRPRQGVLGFSFVPALRRLMCSRIFRGLAAPGACRSHASIDCFVFKRVPSMLSSAVRWKSAKSLVSFRYKRRSARVIASAQSRSITESGGMITCLLRSWSMTERTNTIA
jgi:hypothetical protein